MALSVLITPVGSDFATPLQFTAQSPSIAGYYQMTSTIINYGNLTSAANAGGIVGAGYISVQFHSNNQWKTGNIYTTQNGAALAALINA